MGAVVLILLAGMQVAGTGSATVYYGKLEGADQAAELVAKKVFEEIPEYQEIQRRGLDEDDSEYWVLLSKANEKFFSAVEKVADRKDLDVVVEKGSHDFEEKPPEITRAVINALED